MRRILARAALATVAIGGVAEAKRPSPDQQLARMLEGRVAGEPRDCIFLPSIRGSQVIERTAIVYDAGSVLWVNRPRNGATSLDRDDVLVTRTHGAQLCSIDVVQLVDRSSQIYNGFVSLGEFVPYRKVADARN